MKKIKLLILPVLFTLLTLPVFAVGKPDNPGKESAQVKSCEAREASVIKRSESLTGLVENMLKKFGAIAARVEEYYTSTVEPSGKIVDNYDDLVADIQTKKEVAQAALDTAKSNISGFQCDSDDPKNPLTKFREDMQVVKSTLKDYRTSIKNLIVAVHTAVGNNDE